MLPKAKQRRDQQFHDRRGQHGNAGSSRQQHSKQPPGPANGNDQGQQPHALGMSFNIGYSTQKAEAYAQQQAGKVTKVAIKIACLSAAQKRRATQDAAEARGKRHDAGKRHAALEQSFFGKRR